MLKLNKIIRKEGIKETSFWKKNNFATVSTNCWFPAKPQKLRKENLRPFFYFSSCVTSSGPFSILGGTNFEKRTKSFSLWSELQLQKPKDHDSIGPWNSIGEARNYFCQDSLKKGKSEVAFGISFGINVGIAFCIGIVFGISIVPVFRLNSCVLLRKNYSTCDIMTGMIDLLKVTWHLEARSLFPEHERQWLCKNDILRRQNFSQPAHSDSCDSSAERHFGRPAQTGLLGHPGDWKVLSEPRHLPDDRAPKPGAGGDREWLEEAKLFLWWPGDY